MCNVSRLVLMCNRPPLSIVVAKKRNKTAHQERKFHLCAILKCVFDERVVHCNSWNHLFRLQRIDHWLTKRFLNILPIFFFSFKISKRNTNFASLNLQHICYNGMLLSSNALLILRLKNVFNSWRLALNKNQEQNDAHDELFYLFFSCISVFLSFFVLTTISCLVLDIFFFLQISFNHTPECYNKISH